MIKYHKSASKISDVKRYQFSRHVRQGTDDCTLCKTGPILLVLNTVGAKDPALATIVPARSPSTVERNVKQPGHQRVTERDSETIT